MEDSKNSLVSYLGPAKEEFPSFLHLATYHLDTFFQNWRNYDCPHSYIIPQIFDYKRPDVSDEAIGKIIESSTSPKQPTIVQERDADQAEHFMQRAIWQAIHSGLKAPFIAFHSLNMDEKRLHLLRLIFPHGNWTQFHNELKRVFRDKKRGSTLEYDLLLIGPYIGFIVVEVKSSKFQGSDDFSFGNSHLPTEFKKGINQVDSISTFISLIQECINQENGSIYVRKILFAPNLDRSRYDLWRNQLPHEAGVALKERTAGLIMLFKEDMTIDQTDGVLSVFPKFNEILLETNDLWNSDAQYELYGPFLVGLVSMVTLPSSDEITIGLDHLIYHSSIEKEAQRVDKQSPIESTNKIHSSMLLRSSKDSMTKCLSIIFLTPEQQAVMKGGCRQILAGAAGTGKSILMQEKAMDLLRKGENVTIIAPIRFGLRYKMLFDKQQLTNYVIYDVAVLDAIGGKVQSFDEEDIDVSVLKEDISNVSQSHYNQAQDDYEQNSSMEIAARLNFVETSDEKPSLDIVYKNIFVDDLFCQEFIGGSAVFFQVSRGMKSLINVFADSDCTIWIAYDPYQSLSSTDEDDSEEAIFHRQNQLLEFLMKDYEFSRVLLHRVMRCSEEVYRSAYSDFDWPLVTLNPIAGHKIQGIKTQIIRKDFQTADQANMATVDWVTKIVGEKMNLRTDCSSNMSAYIGIIMDTGGDVSQFTEELPTKLQRYAKVAFLNNCVHGEIGADMTTYQCLSSDMLIRATDADVVICTDVANAASFEWPFVIHIRLVYKSYLGTEDELTKRRIYLARSRAMVGYIELVFTMNDDPDVLETDNADEEG